MNIKITETRVYGTDESGQEIAEATFKEIDKGLYNINHVRVDDKYQGQGLAGQIVEATVKEIQDRGGVPISSCSYGAKWLSDHHVPGL